MVYLKYSGTLQSKEMIALLTEEFIDICRISGWGYDVIKENFQTMTAKPEADKARHSRHEELIESVALSSSEIFLEGIAIKIRPDCDPIKLTFDGNCSLAAIDFSFTNTVGLNAKLTVKKYQFMHYPQIKINTIGADYHSQVVKILDYVKKRYVKDLKVIDSSNYWETRDEEMLRVKIWKSSIKQSAL